MKNEIKIKKSGSKLDNSYRLTADLTAGQILAIKNAFETAGPINGSPVAYDVLMMLIRAIKECKELDF